MPTEPPVLAVPPKEDAAWIPPPAQVRRKMVALMDRLLPMLPLPARALVGSMARERLSSLSDHDTIQLLLTVDELNSELWSGDEPPGQA